LERKERTFLKHPTPEMLAYFNKSVVARFSADLPAPADTFVATDQIKSEKLLTAMKRFYLLESAASRDEAVRNPATGSDDKVPTLDWDGVTRVREAVMPDDELI